MTENLCVFISYKREDQAEAEKLWQLLGEWGYDRWLDVKNIRAGVSPQTSTWIDSIHGGLKASQVLIGLVTTESLRSQNVKDEWYWARQNRRRILLVRLRPFDAEEMPPPFVETDYIDLHQDREQGILRLQNELQTLLQDRSDFQREITPPPVQPDAAPDIPAYLQDTLQTKKYVPWRMTLRFLGGIAVPVALLWLVVDVGFEPLLTLLAALATLIASWVGEQSPDDLDPNSKLTDIEQMRKLVYEYWVQGVKDTALKEVDAAGIGMSQPEAVVRSVKRNLGDIDLPNDSRHVREVYNTFGSFLILGDPGAGKTIMLLQLAESLIIAPPTTHKNAIPLVLNLSSWTLDPKPLQDWLEDETWRTYRVRGRRVRDWLADNQLILLLDGLDEVKEEQRAACVEAINAFRAKYDYVPLVVCSRIKDYERLGETQLELSGAILLEALSREQVDRYLSDPQLAHLKQVVAEDPVLGAMSTTPFLLNTMIYAYRDLPESALRGFEGEAARREHLFTTYVQRRLSDNPTRYGYKQTVAYLEWLATKMQAYVQTVFHPSDINRDWVADDEEGYEIIFRNFRIAYAIVMMILYGWVGWRMGGIIGLLSWGVGGLIVGALIFYYEQFRIRERDDQIWQNLYKDGEIRNLLLYILFAIPLSLVLIQQGSAYLPEWVAFVLVASGVGWLILPLQAREAFKSWGDFRDYSLLLIVSALLFGGSAWSLTNTLTWAVWIEILLVVGVSILVMLHAFGIEAHESERKLDSRRILQRVVTATIVTGAGFGLLGSLVNAGFALGLAAALTYGGFFGATALSAPLALWLRLRQQNRLPLRTEQFLRDMTERQIIRRMGGGYIFIHRYLLENFAGVDEVYVLFEQIKDEKRREKAVATLKQLAEKSPATVRTLETLVAWDRPDVHWTQRMDGIDILRQQGVELPDNRPGVGMDENGLPDIDWVTIPAGEFIYQDGKMTLDYDFQISRYPVTYAQFQAFLDAPDGYDSKDPDWFDGLAADDDDRQMREQAFQYDNHPRENVSWFEAVAFCRWLSWRLEALTPSPSPTGRGEENPRQMASEVMVRVARDLRQRQTPAEEIAWACLRDRRLGGLKFRRQHPVANTAYVVDFYCHQHRLVVELDGDVHRSQEKEDRWRQAALEDLGLTVLRFTNDQIFNNLESVLTTILRYTNFPLSPWERGPGGEGQWQIRLPTEFEWERAARGTDGREYPWGDGYREGYANIDETYQQAGQYYLRQTSAVGMFPDGASPAGVLDLSGNVWEWCLTDYDNPQARAADADMRSNTRRVLRGGSWNRNRSSARAAYRYYGFPYLRSSYDGFRLVRAPSP